MKVVYKFKLYVFPILLICSSWFALSVSSERGKTIFNKLCTKCHGMKGEGKKEIKVPAIAGRAEWAVSYMLKSRYRHESFAKDPNHPPGARMGVVVKMISDQDIDLVAKHVAKMPQVKLKHEIVGDPENGEQKYLICSACHGQNAEGNELLKAPPLVGLPDWYLYDAIDLYLPPKGHRAKFPEGAVMIAGAQAVQNEKDRKDVIDYILALQGERGNPPKEKKSKKEHNDKKQGKVTIQKKSKL